MYTNYWIFAMIASYASFVSQTLGCPTLKTPKFASMKCKSAEDGLKVCTFSCKPWTTMLGSFELTCGKGSNEWSGPPPVCYADYNNCQPHKTERCPKTTKSDTRALKALNIPKSREEQKTIAFITEHYEASRVKRSVVRHHCLKDMCRIRCLDLPRYARRRCITCKRRMQINCKRGGSLFGF